MMWPEGLPELICDTLSRSKQNQHNTDSGNSKEFTDEFFLIVLCVHKLMLLICVWQQTLACLPRLMLVFAFRYFFNPAFPFPFFSTHWTFLHALLRMLGPPLWNHCCRVYCFNTAFTNETLTRGYRHKPGEISRHFLSNFYLLSIFLTNYGYDIIILCVCEWQRPREVCT